MFRLFYLLVAVTGVWTASAQVTITPVVNGKPLTEKPIDYTQMGAPMPFLRLYKYEDTNKLNNTAAPNTGNTGVAKAKKKKKNNKHTPLEPIQVTGPRKFITSQDLDNGASLFVMMFNPNCSHCEDVTELLEKNIALFKKSKIVLLANPVMYEYLPNFSKSFHISDYPTIHLGADSSDFINKVFLYQALPQINVYDRNRKLVRTFTGEQVIDSLAMFVE